VNASGREIFLEKEFSPSLGIRISNCFLFMPFFFSVLRNKISLPEKRFTMGIFLENKNKL